MKVLNLEPYGYSANAIEFWHQNGFRYEESSWSKIDSLHTNDITVVVLIVRLERKIDIGILKIFPSLKYILSATTGLDHLDVEEFERRGVRIISLRGEYEFLQTITSTAEHTWALLLSLVRNITRAVSDVHIGNWQRDRFRGYQLAGKNIGIVGLGRTGRQVAGYAQAFGMHVLYYDPNVQAADGLFKCASLRELFQSADAVSLHVHLTEESRFLINEEILGYAKKGCVLINTSRGLIWDEHAVVKALQSGALRGVATDVLATELHSIQESPLWRAAGAGLNIIITPHLGGATWDAMWLCEEFIVRKAIQMIK